MLVFFMVFFVMVVFVVVVFVAVVLVVVVFVVIVCFVFLCLGWLYQHHHQTKCLHFLPFKVQEMAQKRPNMPPITQQKSPKKCIFAPFFSFNFYFRTTFLDQRSLFQTVKQFFVVAIHSNTHMDIHCNLTFADFWRGMRMLDLKILMYKR